MVRIVNVPASFTNDETANLISTEVCPLQNVNDFNAKQLTHAFAHLRRLNPQINAVLVNRFDDFFFALSRFYVVLEKCGASFARRARHFRHHTVLNFKGNLLQVEKFERFVEEG
jgi:hypothetical protein